MKVSSVSKAALAAMLVAGSLAATPLIANADTSDPVTVTTDQGKNKQISVSVKSNDDGSKTVSVTMPKDEVVGSASTKDNTFTATTASDKNTSTDIDKGKVTVKGDDAKIKLELDSSAISNKDLMNTPMQIDISDANGKHVGKISNVTLNDLMKQAQKQQGEKKADLSSVSSSAVNSSSASSSDKTATSSSANDSGDWWFKDGANSSTQTSNAENNSSSTSTAASPAGSAQTQSSSNSASSTPGQKKVQTYNSVADLVAAIKKNGVESVRDSNVIVTPSNVAIDDDGTEFDGGDGTLFSSRDKSDENVVKTGQPVEVTINTIDDMSQYKADGLVDGGDYDYYIQFSNPRTPENNPNGQGQGSNSNGQTGQPGNGSNNQNNGSIPQTGDNHSIWSVIAGSVSAGFGALGSFFSKNFFLKLNN